MIVNLKRLLIVISSFSFIFCANEPFLHNIEYENSKYIPDIIININNKNNSVLIFTNSECNLYFIEKTKKYIFSEDGNEIIYQIKYINEGNSDKCMLQRYLQESYDVSDIKIKGGNNLKYNITSDTIEFYFNLKSKKNAIISYKTFYKYSPSKFYRVFTPYIEQSTKYTFRAKQPFEIVGIKYGRLKEAKQKNEALYYYYNGNEYDFNETIYLSVYGIKFKSDLTVKLDFTIGRILKYITVPNLHEFGNNEIISNEVLSNLKRNEYTIENDKRFITIKSNERYRKFIFTFSKEFQSKIDNEWIMDGADLVDNCTINIKNKVEEILSNKNSQEEDYIILGRWVYYNIEYNLDYLHEKWTVDQILEKKVGVCSHKTRLYNAFLNCINIDAMYTSGFAHTKNDNNVDLETLHAWTVAKIDGKWVPLDATWNIFNGKLPLSHIFRYYGDIYRDTYADWGIFGDILSNIKLDTKLQSDSNPKTDLEIKELLFLSLELEDDEEGDFELNLNDNIYIYIIISLIIIFLFAAIIGGLIYYLKKKKNNTNYPDLKISLSNNEDLKPLNYYH